MSHLFHTLPFLPFFHYILPYAHFLLPITYYPYLSYFFSLRIYILSFFLSLPSFYNSIYLFVYLTSLLLSSLVFSYLLSLPSIIRSIFVYLTSFFLSSLLFSYFLSLPSIIRSISSFTLPRLPSRYPINERITHYRPHVNDPKRPNRYERPGDYPSCNFNAQVRWMWVLPVCNLFVQFFFFLT